MLTMLAVDGALRAGCLFLNKGFSKMIDAQFKHPYNVGSSSRFLFMASIVLLGWKRFNFSLFSLRLSVPLRHITINIIAAAKHNQQQAMRSFWGRGL